MKNGLRRELFTWAQYFLIAFVAAAIAYDVIDASTREIDASWNYFFGRSNAEGGAYDVQINTREMILSMWRDYFRWWFGVFIGLSLIRFVILFIVRYITVKAIKVESYR